MAVPDSGVSAKVVRPIVAGLLMRGLDAEAALAEAGIDPERLSDPDARVPHRAAASLWVAAVEKTGDEAFGLHVAEATDLGEFDVQLYAFLSSATLGEGLERVSRYHRLSHDVASLSVIRRGDEALFRHQLPGGYHLPAAAAQFVMSAVVLAARNAVDGLEITEVRLQQDAPAEPGEFTRVLGTTVSFRQEHDELVLPATALELPHKKADSRLARVLDRHGQALLDAMPRVHSTADRVRAFVARQLQGGDPSAAAAARHLHMSPRTLSRRLADEDTSHKDILDGLRQELALRYLGDPDLAISEVAFLLGFSEPSAFHRAFRRWTDQTPAQFRQRRSPA